MLLLPFERLTIKTHLRPIDAIQELEAVIEPKKFFRSWTPASKPYEGKIEGAHFTVNRIMGYRNSFKPEITGSIQPDIGGSTIKISMYPHIFATIFTIIWMGSAGVIFLILLNGLMWPSYQGGIEDHITLANVLETAGMIPFGYAILLGGFKIESVRSKAYFRKLFQAQEVEEFGINSLFQPK